MASIVKYNISNNNAKFYKCLQISGKSFWHKAPFKLSAGCISFSLVKVTANRKNKLSTLKGAVL